MLRANDGRKVWCQLSRAGWRLRDVLVPTDITSLKRREDSLGIRPTTMS